MNRRKFLALLGAGALSAAAGCSNPTESVYDQAEGTAVSTQQPEVDEDAVACREGDRCIGNFVTVRQIESITDSTLTVRANVQYADRDFTLNVYQNTPSANDPGTVETEQLLRTPRWNENTQEWQPGPNSFEDYRAVWSYETQGQLVDSYDIKNAVNHGRADFHDDDDIVLHGAPMVTLDIDIPEPPTGVPVTYTFERYEPTIEGQPSIIASRTQPIIQAPSGEFLYPERDDFGNQSDFSTDFFDRRYESIEGDDAYRLKMMFATSPGRFSMSSRRYDELESQLDEQPLPTDFGRLMWNGTMLRPWYYEVDIPVDAVEEQSELNNERYIDTGAYNSDGRVIAPEDPNILRITNDSDFVDHQIIQDIAQDLRDMADTLGFTSEAQQTRIAADFAQRVPYSLGPQATIGAVQPPLETLAYGYGDCEDQALLLYSLLDQDVFDVSPVIAAMDNVGTQTWFSGADAAEDAAIASTSDKNQTGHIGVGVDLDEDGPGAFESNFGQFSQFGDYTYVEASTLCPLGWLYEDYPQPYVL